MNALDADDTFADLVTARPWVAAQLDRLGLDHCCGGQRRLADAVHEAGLDLAGDLLARLRPATGGYAVPDDGCASYRALYTGLVELEAGTHRHVHRENNLLFPAVLATEAALAGGAA